MTLGEWLNQVILEDTVADEPAIPPRYGYDRSSHDRRQAFAGDPAPRRIETPAHPSDEVIGVREALDRLSARIEAAEHRSTLAITGIDQSVTGLVSRLGGAEREQTAVAARFEGAVEDLRRDHSRMVDRLRKMETESAGPRSMEALRALEGALAKVATHVYDGEERTLDVVGGLRHDIDSLAEQVKTGMAGTATTELVDSVVARIAERLEQAEGRTTAALHRLETSFAQLDNRLNSAEQRLEGKSSDASLEKLATSLTARVDAARAEMAEKIRGAADGRVDRLERTLQEMTGHVQAAERRSAQAIEKMGHEVLRVADVLGRKVQDVETRSATAIEQVGGEVARIADAMETRLTRVDTAGAQALEKLGGEIARITERLAERIADAERRSAQAIDDVGDQLSRVTDRMQDRQERVSSELGDRIRQSEERTARLLEDARARIDQRLSDTNRRLDMVKTAPEPVYVAQPYVAAPYLKDDVAPFGHDSFAERGQAARDPLAVDLGPEPAQDFLAEAPVAELEAEIVAEAFEEPAIEEAPAKPATFAEQMAATHRFAAQSFAGQDQGVEAELAASAPGEVEIFEDAVFASAHDEVADPQDTAPQIVRSRFDDPLFEEPRAEQPKLEEPEEDSLEAIARRHAEAAVDPLESLFAAATAPSTRDVVQRARAAARAQAAQAQAKPRTRYRGPSIDPSSLYAGMPSSAGRKRTRRRQGSTLNTFLAIAGGAAALGVSVAGYEILSEKPTGPMPARVAEALAAHGFGQAAKPTATDQAASTIAALALAPNSASTSAIAPAAAPPAPSADAIALYGEGARRIEAHDFTGVETLKKSANLGYAPAQFYLAKLYEEGSAGVKKDSAEARRWTQRAAEAGDKKAMHNLALYYFEGTGGPKNTTTAAEWFHRAADLGLTDSQYNLGRLYEEGFGVAQNPAEAYKWYLIAAQGGDNESRASALRLKGQLSAEAQAAAERAAQSYHPQAPGPQTQVAQNVSPVVTAQRALAHLGYYQGPADGAASPALKFAIAAYQRDQGLPATGALDSAMNDRLGMIAQ